MKIGTFAKHNGVSIDTVRHYINLELIIPQKVNRQYSFDGQCQRDFDEILHLKSLGFSLLEIKNIFVIRHLGKMTSYQQEEYYKDIFRNRQEAIGAEMEKLSREKSRLEEELRRLDTESETKRFSMGIDLSWLQYLRCDACGGPLVLSQSTVDDNMVMSGTLKCGCGAVYTVEDGILFVGAGKGGEGMPPDILSYIRHTDSEYLSRIYKTLEWSAQAIDLKALSGKVILELGSGSGFFLRWIYDDLPDDAVYVAVDYDPERLRFLKDVLEKSERRKSVLFLCCDFSRIPLLPRSVDVVCDFSGTSNYCFDHSDFLLQSIERYFKADAALLGSYILFKNFGPDSMVPADCRPNFRLDTVKKQIERLGFIKRADFLSDVITKGGIYESYFTDEEKVLTYSFYGKRLG